MKTYNVYILKCADESYYTSITGELEKRLEEHHAGKRKSTQYRRPVKLVFNAEFSKISMAVHSELEIKQWTRTQKEALIKRGKQATPSLLQRQLVLEM